MAKKYQPKFFRVAIAETTVDGREITSQQIQEMANTYSPKDCHGARIWNEHFRGFIPGGIGDALGDVLELKAEKITDGKHKGKLALFAKIKPLPKLIDINNMGQKLYTSIELIKNYCGKGTAYMFGLAVTDTPASQGTEMLSFNVAGTDIYTTEFLETNFEFEEVKEEGPSLFSRVNALLGKKDQKEAEKFSDVDKSVLAIAKSQDEHQASFSALQVELEQATNNFTALKSDNDKLQERFNSLETKLKETTPALFTHRPDSDGGGGEAAQTDC